MKDKLHVYKILSINSIEQPTGSMEAPATNAKSQILTVPLIIKIIGKLDDDSGIMK